MPEKEHVIEVLENAKKAARNEDVYGLKNLSNQTVHTASIEQDSNDIMVAVVVYALSKIIERKSSYGGKLYNSYLNYYIGIIDRFIDAVRTDDPNKFNKYLKDVISGSSFLSSDLKKNVQDIFQKARINKASKIYEHGISMAQTAKLLGISLWELAEYAGQSGASDVPLIKTLDVKKRIDIAMEIFK